VAGVIAVNHGLRRVCSKRLQSERERAEHAIATLEGEIKRLLDGFAAGALTVEELSARRKDRDEAITAQRQRLAEASEAVERMGFEDLEQRIELVVSSLSQRGFHELEPEVNLHVLFPNRKLLASQHYNTRKMSIAEFFSTAPGFPATDDYSLGREFIELVQKLVTRVTLDTEGHIVDFVLLIGPSSAAEGPDGQDENHRANLNSITSPSNTTYSLPSNRTSPFSLAPTLEPEVTRSS
jgi:hypothetical protein